MVRAQRTQLKFVAAAFVAGTVAIACGGGGDDKKPDAIDPGTGSSDDAGTTGTTSGKELTLVFNPMYSAYDGKHTFKLPVLVTGATGKLTVSTTPDGFVDSDIAGDVVTLTTKKSGDCTVVIKDADGNTGMAPLKITKNDPGDVEIGADRYSNGMNAFDIPEGGLQLPEGGFPDSGLIFADGGLFYPDGGRFQFPEGGFQIPEGGAGNPLGMRNPDSACTFCHKPVGAPMGTGPLDRIDVEHTPQQTAGYSDEELIAIFTEAKKPAGSKWRVLPAAFAPIIYPTFHKWNVGADIQKGIVAYLRQLTPAPDGPALDFGGFRAGGGAARMDAGVAPAP
jgi:hypothetical protein